MQVQSLGWENPLEEGMATHSSVLAWRIPGMGEPGGLLSQVRVFSSESALYIRWPKYWNFSFSPRPRELRAFFSCMAWRAIPAGKAGNPFQTTQGHWKD